MTTPLTPEERESFAALIKQRGWSERDLRVFALQHVDLTGSTNPNRIVRWLLDDVTPGTVDGEIATCARCGREIIWEFDNELEPYGMWSSEETLDSCTPGPNDEDRWHTPAPVTD